MLAFLQADRHGGKPAARPDRLLGQAPFGRRQDARGERRGEPYLHSSRALLRRRHERTQPEDGGVPERGD